MERSSPRERQIDVELHRPEPLPPAGLGSRVEEVDRAGQQIDLVGEEERDSAPRSAEGVLARLHVGGEVDLGEPGQVDVDVGADDTAHESGALGTAAVARLEEAILERVIAAHRQVPADRRDGVLHLRIEHVVVGADGGGGARLGPDAEDADREARLEGEELVLGDAQLGVEKERIAPGQEEVEANLHLQAVPGKDAHGEPGGDGIDGRAVGAGCRPVPEIRVVGDVRHEERLDGGIRRRPERRGRSGAGGGCDEECGDDQPLHWYLLG